MNSRLVQKINENSQAPAVLHVITHIQKAGYVAYLVGGGVRDMILGCSPKDFDVATDAHPEDLQKLFPDSLLVGAKFGVLLVKVQGLTVEVATFRKEGQYHDRRRPDLVEFSTLDQDAARRDFTCNAIYFDPVSSELVDYFNGLDDIRNRVIRTVGLPQDRFSEDALRLIRAIRFAAELDFLIHPDTWTSLCSQAHYLQEISVERVSSELIRGFCGPNPWRFLSLLDDSGVLQLFIPEIEDLKTCQQPPEFHPEGDVFAHLSLMLRKMKPYPPAVLVFAVLFHDIGKPATRTLDGTRIRFNGHDKVGAEMAQRIMRRLKLSNHLIDAVVFIVRRHMQFINVPSMKVSTLKKFLSSSLIEHELELHRLDCLASNGDLSTYNYTKHSLKNLQTNLGSITLPPHLISGHDLIELGLSPGPQFSRILDAVYTEQLEGTITDKASALALALRIKNSAH